MMKDLSKFSALILGVGLSMTALAADPLAGTQWVTYDKGQPKSIIKITENNHKLSGTIVKLLAPRATGKTVCDICQGKFHNKPLTGATVFTGLTATGNGRYEGGNITDPESGKTYSMSATLNGTSLDVRGYIGVTVLGRTQTWQKK